MNIYISKLTILILLLLAAGVTLLHGAADYYPEMKPVFAWGSIALMVVTVFWRALADINEEQRRDDERTGQAD